MQPSFCLSISDAKPSPPGPCRINDEAMSPFVGSLALKNSARAPLHCRHRGPGCV